MGKALEVLAGSATAPGTTLTALTMAAGNSLTMRNAAPDSMIHLLTAWVKSRTGARFRIRSPQLHDNVEGIRMFHVASEVRPLLNPRFKQRLFPQDILTAELSGSATALDIEIAALLIYYEDLPGIDARLMTPDEVMERMRHVLTVENTLALGTAGGYSGEEAINAEFDLLKANTDYAILGYLVSVECGLIRYRGADTGNLGIGGPGHEQEKEFTGRFFVWLSEMTGLPCIPVFNSANKAAVLIDGFQDEDGVDVTLTTILAELKAA